MDINICVLYEHITQHRELDPGVARLILRKILDIMATGKDPPSGAIADNERKDQR